MKTNKVHPAVSKYYSDLAKKGAKKRAERLIKEGLLTTSSKVGEVNKIKDSI